MRLFMIQTLYYNYVLNIFLKYDSLRIKIDEYRQTVVGWILTLWEKMSTFSGTLSTTRIFKRINSCWRAMGDVWMYGWRERGNLWRKSLSMAWSIRHQCWPQHVCLITHPKTKQRGQAVYMPERIPSHCAFLSALPERAQHMFLSLTICSKTSK